MHTQDQRPEIGSSEIAGDTEARLTVPGQSMPENKNPEQEKPPLTPRQEALRRLRQDKRAIVSLSVLAFFVLLALIGPPIYQHIGGQVKSDLIGMIGPDTYHLPDQGQATQADEGPTARYWLGTDYLGRDILARI